MRCAELKSCERKAAKLLPAVLQSADGPQFALGIPTMYGLRIELPTDEELALAQHDAAFEAPTLHVDCATQECQYSGDGVPLVLSSCNSSSPALRWAATPAVRQRR